MAKKLAINKRIRSIVQAKANQARFLTPPTVRVLVKTHGVAPYMFPIAWV
jgi:hypothetical protein